MRQTRQAGVIQKTKNISLRPDRLQRITGAGIGTIP
jgi:hypothetical protein